MNELIEIDKGISDDALKDIGLGYRRKSVEGIMGFALCVYELKRRSTGVSGR